MYSIKHLFHINASQEKVFWAITSLEGLKGWWTHHTSGETGLNGIIQFKFPPVFSNEMKVVLEEKNKRVIWECMDGVPDWIGTKIVFELDRNEDKTRLRFEHAEWEENDDFYAICSFSWGRYLESMRQLIEIGKGQPFK